MMDRKKLVKRELTLMRRKAHRVRIISAIVMNELWAVENIWLTSANQQRLYQWWVWSQRHKIPIRYIIKKVVGWAREKTAKRKNNKQTFGMRLVSLTSKKMEAMLIDMIASDFPNGEHIYEWNQLKREKLLQLDEPRGKVKPLLNPFVLEHTLYNYVKGIRRRVRKLDRATSSQQRQHRNWRGNPW